jgi:hypothetical protein
MTHPSKRHSLLATAFAAALSATAPAQAANWLMLQGTEPEGAAARAKIWGFVQPQYAKTDGSELAAGPWKGQDAAFNQIPPDLDSDSQFHIQRARLGVRGTGFPLDSNVNYFLLAEFGNNGITNESGGNAKLTDASITLNHLKDYTRVRFGQFKTPGSEDGLQAIHVHNYTSFSLAADGLLLERFFDWDGSGGCLVPEGDLDSDSANAYQQCKDGNEFNGPVGAYRDVGLQLFNSFTLDDGPGKYPWELSYAVMVGNGNGIDRGDNDDNKDMYYYASAGQIFGGKGGRRQDWKLFGWYNKGDRTIKTGSPGSLVEDEFERKRWGLGGTLRWNKYRLYGEYIKADGMIFNGTDGGAVPGATGTLPNGRNVVSTFNVLTDDEADGWYIDAGYMVLPNLELDVRYDKYNRGTETDAGEREFTRWTVGAQYFFNKKSRFILNYEFRDAEAPELSSSATPNQILDDFDNRLSAQVLVIF